MSESLAPQEGVESRSNLSGDSAGAMLRNARLAHGLDLDTLASALKVSSRKLELLEQDQYDQLPGLTFVRSLAQSVCRYLQVDAQQVLALLPTAAVPQDALEHVTRGLATPFREPGARVNLSNWFEWLRPSLIAPALLLLLALGLWLMPSGRDWLGSFGRLLPAGSAASAPAEAEAASAVTQVVTPVLPAATAASGPAISGLAPMPIAPVIETVHSAPPEEPTASPPQAPPAAGAVVLRPSAESWVEVRDAVGTVLLSRMLPPGEVVGLDGRLPLKLKIGNAETMRLSFKGQPIDLAPYTRDNVARIELK